MNQTIVNTPKPPSLEEIYRKNISGGLGAVFAEYDAQLRKLADQQKAAAGAGGAPIHPGQGRQALTTPRQRASTTAATSASATRLGWIRVSGLAESNSINFVTTKDGWPISFARLSQAGNIRSNGLVQFQYSIPPVDTPYTDTNGVRSYDTSAWPVPSYWKERKNDILFPVLSIQLVPSGADYPNTGGIDETRLTLKTITAHTPLPRPTPPAIPPGNIAEGSIDKWSVIAWLEDYLGRPVQLSHAFAELL